MHAEGYEFESRYLHYGLKCYLAAHGVWDAGVRVQIPAARMACNKITWTELQLREALRKCNSLQEIEQFLGLSGNNYVTIRKKAAEWGIDLSNFEKRPKLKYSKLTLEEIFCKDSKASPATVRWNVKKYNLIEYKCHKCKLISIIDGIAYWNNEPITLQLDHINGKSKDHRLENLQWLCSNCHSQTITYGAKNAHKNLNNNRTLTIVAQNENSKKIIVKLCRFCIKPFTAHREQTILCSNECAKAELLKNSKGKTKISKEDLAKLVWQKPLSAIAKELGVSDKAVAKWCKQYNIEVPGRGYWTKSKKG